MLLPCLEPSAWLPVSFGMQSQVPSLGVCVWSLVISLLHLRPVLPSALPFVRSGLLAIPKHQALFPLCTPCTPGVPFPGTSQLTPHVFQSLLECDLSPCLATVYVACLISLQHMSHLRVTPPRENTNPMGTRPLPVLLTSVSPALKSDWHTVGT